MQIFKNRLPKKYIGRGKCHNKPFKMNYVDVLISPRKECQNCKCQLTFNAKNCSRCKHKKLIPIYLVEECKYTVHTCSVNRWGCSIHYKDRSHGITCVCDECM